MNTMSCGHIKSGSHCKICDEKPQKKKRKRIPFASEKRRAELKEYSELGKKFLMENRVCQCKNCTKHSMDIHHVKGRGKYLNDVSTWMAVCRDCHDSIHGGDPLRAKEMGYTESRLTD